MTDPNGMLPILRQFHDADGDGERARLLLNLSDTLIGKYREAFERACRVARFDEGRTYIALRVNSFRAVRDDLGNLPKETALALKTSREVLVALAMAAGPQNQRVYDQEARDA